MAHSTITLYCTEGSADKQYTVTIEPAAGGLFHVVCFNGRRGGTQRTQPKTKDPVSLDQAQKLYDQIVAKQKRGGYTPDESGVPYALTEKAGEVSGWLPALLTEIDETDLERFVRDDAWCAQEKYDEVRRAVEITADGPRGMNKKGLYVNVPASWTHILAGLPNGTILDGEQVGQVLYAFDIVRLGGRDLSGLGFEERERLLLSLEPLLAQHKDGAVTIVRAERGEQRKRALLKDVEAANGEGVVFRRVDGTYRPGEASSVASAVLIKFKFKESATCIVSSVSSTKRSVGLSLLDANGDEIGVGNVTIQANKLVPSLGDIVEVRFLYKFERGCLFQPVFLGQRVDQDRSDALLRKIVRIKRKSATPLELEEEAAEAA